jgi:hypothetical protein
MIKPPAGPSRRVVLYIVLAVIGGPVGHYTAVWLSGQMEKLFGAGISTLAIAPLIGLFVGSAFLLGGLVGSGRIAGKRKRRTH